MIAAEKRFARPIPASDVKTFSLVDCLSIGVDRMQRNSNPMRKVEAWLQSELTDVTAKGGHVRSVGRRQLKAPKHLARTGRDLYFEPKYEEFLPPTIWSLSTAFTSEVTIVAGIE